MIAATAKATEPNGTASKRSTPLATIADGRGKNGHESAKRKRAIIPLSTVTDSRPKNGHDAKGRFTRGNKEARGNPFARRLGKLRALVLDAVLDEDVRAVIRKLVDLAKAGNPAAAKLLLAYVIGRPTEAVNPDRLDLDEFRLLEDCPTPAKVLRVLLGGLKPGPVVDLVHGHLTTKRVAKEIFRSDQTDQILREQRARTGK